MGHVIFIEELQNPFLGPLLVIDFLLKGDFFTFIFKFSLMNKDSIGTVWDLKIKGSAHP